MAQESGGDVKAPGRGGRSVAGLLAGLVAGLLAGALVWFVALRTPELPVSDGAGAGAPLASAKPDPVAQTAPAPQLAPASEAPGFDTVRSETDGSVLVAGRARAGARVSIEVNGAAQAAVQADPQGKFAAFLSLPSGTVPNVVTLTTQAEDGTVLRSNESVILKPVEAPLPQPAQEAATDAPTAPDLSRTATGSQAPASAPAALLADPDGVRKLAPGASDSVVVDTISYGADGAVELSGRAEAGTGGHVQAYLDNAPAGQAAVGGDGSWGMRLGGIAPGLYTLRVDQTDAEGKVVSRFETPFQREDMTAVAAAPPAGVSTSAAPEGATATASAVPADQSAPQKVSAGIITVQPGYTLWAIARSNYGDGLLYVKVFEANRDQIRNPDLIYPGQVFSVPKD